MRYLFAILAVTMACSSAPDAREAPVESASDATPDETADARVEEIADSATVASDTKTAVTDTAVEATDTSSETMMEAGPPICAGAVRLSTTWASPAETARTSSNAYKLSCGGSTGFDVVFELTLTARSHVKLSASVLDAEPFKNTPAIAIRKTCDGPDITCKAGISPETEATLDAGTYAIVVDSDRATAGDVHVRAEITPVLDCAAAKPLVFASGVAKASGDTSSAKHLAIGCDSTAAPDHLYWFELTKTERVTTTVSGTGFSPSVYLRRTCDDPKSHVELSCTSSSNTQTLAPGKYFLFVDGNLGASGPYDLTVALSPAVEGDSCANPAPLTFVGDTAIYNGTTVGKTNDHTSSCGGVEQDAVHSFTLTELRRVTFNVTTTSSSYGAMLSVRDSCTSGANELACRITSAKYMPPLGYAKPGTYYVFLDGVFKSDVGAYKLEVKTSAPLLGETCDNPEPLTLGVPINGTTVLHGNDYGGRDGPDRVWTFTETVASTRKVTFSTPAFGWTGSIDVYESGCGPGAKIVAFTSNKNDGKPVTATFTTAPGKTYAVMLDTGSWYGGDFSLKVE
jgi:hypothetical protein